MTGDALAEEYERIVEEGRRQGVSGYMLDQAIAHRDGLWKPYADMIANLPFGLEGKCVVDFGCKHGLTLPVFLHFGAARTIGIDVEEEYLDNGASVMNAVYGDRITFVRSHDGLIDLQPDAADMVFANEVISHINHRYLDVVYSEWARILRTGGHLFISDGNNAANAECRRKLRILWGLYDNGPDGAETDRDIVVTSYLTSRKNITCEISPDSTDEEIEFVASNTAGLFGPYLEDEVRRFRETGELFRRPYRLGTCPTYPGASGVLIERAFHPLQVQMSLAEYGLGARQWFAKPKYGWKGWLFFPARNLVWDMFRRGWRVGADEGFQIIGTKR